MNSRPEIEQRVTTSAPTVRVTAEDMQRLRVVVDRHLDGSLAAAAEQLDGELERAVVEPQEQIPPDVVTMRSRILFEDVDTGRRREATLVYPEEADIEQSKISVLAPAGLAVLGLKKDDIIEWPLPNARRTRFRIVEILYQPEASGDFHL
ncbi:Regulator of nucleoside diphosphate kinase [Cystobacter fuscus DSM 2262]|uniref:Regulator of nucleoside diphosphate kinase n=1 Tax=Cystobacter fuscus (strain ATCC 25194 / DSM 2262 / NBRC 100088 / M29) TaxID=1242864 RepID=S9NXC9_CYSF2|nr:nucleoside diphosphate kinase regulator [Cystobacter fuscus]EPX56885.1 Regulator of nucleoside diphosphate kinase [Cystobacter fuscus DSM 2262]